MIYGYCRVSSRSQLENNSFEQQEQEILNKYSNAKISREQFTGTTTHRPLLDALLSQLKQGDTLVVTKLDRLARTTTEGLDTIEGLINRGVSIHILNMGYIDNTPASELIRTIFLAFAKYERDMIVERTQAGKAVAKTKAGFKEGRPKSYTPEQINHALDLLKEHSYTQVESMTRISKATLTREMRKRKALSL